MDAIIRTKNELSWIVGLLGMSREEVSSVLEQLESADNLTEDIYIEHETQPYYRADIVCFTEQIWQSLEKRWLELEKQKAFDQALENRRK